MARVRRGWAAAIVALITVALCTACWPSGRSSEEERVAAVVAAVTAADARVVKVSVEQSVSGFSFGWTVDVVLSGDEPVGPDELSTLLLAARDASEYRPGHINLFAKGESGASVDLTAAADALGLSYTNIGDGITLLSDFIDKSPDSDR